MDTLSDETPGPSARPGVLFFLGDRQEKGHAHQWRDMAQKLREYGA
jgi:hypothetical protein